LSGNAKDGKKARLPISNHPLFPATVALWCAALAGLGSLAIRPAMVESVVTALQLDSIVSASAPPLGATFRIILALSLAALGAFVGAILARRFARPMPVAREATRRTGMIRATGKEVGTGATVSEVNAVEGQSEASGEQPSERSRRRKITINEGVGQPQEVYEDAPLPGAGRTILDVTEFQLEGFVRARPNGPVEETGLSDCPSVGTEPDDDADSAEPDVSDCGSMNGEATSAPIVSEPERSGAEQVTLFERMAGNWQNETENSDSDELAEPEIQCGADLQESSDRTEDRTGSPDEQETETDTSEYANSAVARISSAPLEDLSPVELLERLALSMEKRRELAAGQKSAQQDTSRKQRTIEQQTCEQPVPPEPVIPDALRPINLEANPDAGILPDDNDVPPRWFRANAEADIAAAANIDAMQTAQPADPHSLHKEQQDEPSDGIPDEGHGSQSGLSRTGNARQEFVRIDEPEPDIAEIEPMVVFPGQEAERTARADVPAGPSTNGKHAGPKLGGDLDASPSSTQTVDPPSIDLTLERQEAARTERALRETLATLRRMNGGA